MKNYLKIEHDPFFICERLREIDGSYYLLYNNDTSQYEVHSSDQRGGSFCFAVRYDELDERTITYALRSRKERCDSLIAEMDAYNERLQKEAMNKAVESVMEML